MKTIVVKVGGSAVSKGKDNLFNFSYLARLKQLLTARIKNEEKFFLVLGGGYAMRMYRDMAKAAGIENTTDLHWIGTTVNVLHAELTRAYMGEIADEYTVKFEDYYDGSPLTINKSVSVGGGGRPGHSGDVDAVMAAEKLGTKIIYSLKNVAGVYNADPKIKPDAKLQSKLSWDEYEQIIGYKESHEPGGNYPIDPVATRMAKERGMQFVIVLGEDLENLNKALNGEDFVGTIVVD